MDSRGAHTADPFFDGGGPVVMGPSEQFSKQLDFLKGVSSGASPKRIIHYVALNSSTWQETERWPPSDVAVSTWFLSDGRHLVRGAPKPRGENRQVVDFSSTTGPQNRWRGNFFAGPINYGNRAHADEKLSYYDTEQLPRDVEIVGDPLVKLSLRVDRIDAAVFVYLEDIATDGRVTYLTEGQLRLMHRGAESPCERTFRRSDALPVIPGESVEASVCLQPIAAHVKAGHRLRVAIAAADADTFARYPPTGGLNLDILYGGPAPSSVEIPIRPWR